MKLMNVNEMFKQSFDYIMDVRSPREFEESHIIGAKNFYVLDNKEHQEIGSLYKKDKEAAKKRGVKYILKNISIQLEEWEFENKKVLVYCKRGGKRSTSLATILSQLNVDVYKLEGGYKSYRDYVLKYFENLPFRFVVLTGNSGCGKSDLLNVLPNSLDLEKLANHYGSTFGSRGSQPSQKQFENLIFENLRKLDINKPVFIESESSRIGKLFIPKPLLDKMRNSPKIEITSPIEKRVKRILKYYKDIDKNEFYKNIDTIKKYTSKEKLEEVKNFYEKGDLKEVAKILLIDYYDKVYKKNKAEAVVENIDLEKAKKEILKIVKDKKW